MKTILLIAFLLLSHRGHGFEIPSFTAPVLDQAGMMSGDTVSELSRELESIYQAGGPQIGVLIVPTLDEQSIEERAIQVFDQWKIGKNGKDNGILILIAKKERKIRIEVGYGLEGDIPDARAKRIIEDLMLPQFRQGDFNSGVIIGIQQIAHFAHVDLKNITPRKSNKNVSDIAWLVVYLPLFFLTLLLGFLDKRKNGQNAKRRPRFFRGIFGGGHWGGGGGSWGGGGSGWGGGGGSSGGGGASGGW